MSSQSSSNNHLVIALIVILLSTLIPHTSSEWVSCVNETLYAGEGAIEILFNDSEPTNASGAAIQIILRGPANKWFGVGFGQHIMNNTYAILSSKDIFVVEERSLGFHEEGYVIASTFNDMTKEELVYKNAYVRNISIQRPLDDDGRDEVFDFTEWLDCTFDLDIIEAVGTNLNVSFHEAGKWNTRTISSCKCPTPAPTATISDVGPLLAEFWANNNGTYPAELNDLFAIDYPAFTPQMILSATTREIKYIDGDLVNNYLVSSAGDTFKDNYIKPVFCNVASVADAYVQATVSNAVEDGIMSVNRTFSRIQSITTAPISLCNGPRRGCMPYKSPEQGLGPLGELIYLQYCIYEESKWIPCVDELPLFAGAGVMYIEYSNGCVDAAGVDCAEYNECAGCEISKEPQINIHLRGPGNTWFGVGFGQWVMNNTYALIAGGYGYDGYKVEQYALSNHELLTNNKIAQPFDDENLLQLGSVREYDVTRAISIAGEANYDFAPWLNCTVDLEIIEATGEAGEYLTVWHKGNKWNDRRIRSCKCPTPAPTNIPTPAPTDIPTPAPTIKWIPCVNEFPLFAGEGTISFLFEEDKPNDPGKAIKIDLKGPAGKWFGVGFGQHTMNNTYAILSTKDVFDVDEYVLGFHNIGQPTLQPTFSSITKLSLADTRQAIIERDLIVADQEEVFDFGDWLDCKFELDLEIIEAVGTSQAATYHDKTKWNTRTIRSCKCPTQIPTSEPTMEPTLLPTTASPTVRLCDGARYKDIMIGNRNDTLLPNQDFVSNSCHCKMTLHPNGSLTLYGRIDEFADFVAGWSTNTKVHNFSGISVPQFEVINEELGTIAIKEYNYAPNVDAVPIWQVDIENNAGTARSIRRLQEGSNNFTFHLTDDCCLSIRDTNNDIIYWSVCLNQTDTESSDGEGLEEDKSDNVLLIGLGVAMGIICCCLCLAICYGCFIHTKYKKVCNESKSVQLKSGMYAVGANSPQCDVDDGYANDSDVKTKGKYDSYNFDDETAKQIAAWDKDVEMDKMKPHRNKVNPRMTDVEIMENAIHSNYSNASTRL